MGIRSYAHKTGRDSAGNATQASLWSLTSLGVAVSCAVTASVQADDAVNAPTEASSNAQTISVEGKKGSVAPNKLPLSIDKLGDSIHDIPQGIDTVTKQVMSEQGVIGVQDALKNVPGITLNSGEGGGHGDDVNLRGIEGRDAFFLDGIRDIGSYTRDSFDIDSVEVVKGPGAALFGRGSTAGVINQSTKQALQAPLDAATLSVASADFWRVTGDVNTVINSTTAARINVMDQSGGVVDRDYVKNRRAGVAAAVAFGMGEANSLNLNYLHQEENNLPDYGIPFVGNGVANVPRNSYYGLPAVDKTQTQVDVATATYRHDFGNAYLTNTLRFGHYWGNFAVSAPDLGDSAPPAGTPLGRIMVYRDQPSSRNTLDDLLNQTEYTRLAYWGGMDHRLLLGMSLEHESNNTTRFVDDKDALDAGITPLIPTTPLLNPTAFPSVPSLSQIAANQASANNGYAGAVHVQSRMAINDVALYANDDVSLNKYWKIDGGVRVDRYRTSFNATDFQQGITAYNSLTTTEVSPRAAVVFRPVSTQSYYLSVGKSYDAANEYLTLAPGGQAVTPSVDRTVEAGAKLDVLQGLLSLNGAVFHTTVSNARIADPDDPTLQGASHDTRVDGFELTALGYVTERWDLDASFTYLRDKVGQANIPAVTAANYTNLPIAGMDEPNVAHATFSAWSVYSLTDDWKVGAGFNHVGQRWADFANTVVLPGYTVWGAMTSYQVNNYVGLQFNANNLTNTRYYTSAYYAQDVENHAVPGAGRTYMLTANLKY